MNALNASTATATRQRVMIGTNEDGRGTANRLSDGTGQPRVTGLRLDLGRRSAPNEISPEIRSTSQVSRVKNSANTQLATTICQPALWTGRSHVHRLGVKPLHLYEETAPL